MIGTFELKVTASQLQKPLPPIFTFRNSPSSLRLLEIPKSIGSWNITRVYIIATSPNNTTQEIDCVRTGNVWVGTFNGCQTAGKVLQGVSIMADGVDENNQPVEGYCLGKSDYYVMDAQSDIKALVEKYEVRYLEELPTNPSTGDMVLFNGTMKFYTGSEWVDFGGSAEGLVTEEEFNEYKAVVSASISAMDSSLSTLSASVSSFGESMGAVESSVSAMASSISAVSASVSALTSSISTMTSSIATLSSTKRDFDDRTWVYNVKTDPLMFGIQSFHIEGNLSEEDLTSFDADTRRWYENDEEGDWFIQAIVDELG